MSLPIESVEAQPVTAVPRVVRCPRCSAPITGDYKFCPTCAFRLRAGGDEAPLPPLQAPRSPWKTGFLASAALATLLACALLGVFLFQPSILFRPEPAPLPTATRDWASLSSPALTVDDLAAELVELPAGYAYWVSLDAISDFGNLDRDRVREQFPDMESVAAYLWYPLRVARYEVTRGQYDEFLRDMEVHPDRVPKSWREADDAGAEVDLLPHVPSSWHVKDERGQDTKAWAVPDVDRNLPVAQVSANDAHAFCEWAAARLDIPLRLPYAMEWVRAARAGELKSRWPWGRAQLIYACNNLASFGRPQFVQFVYPEPPTLGGATPEGIFALAGNVAEWTLDHAFRLQPQLLGQPPTVLWKPYAKASATVLAYGGSFRSGIDDCQVESYVPYYASDSTRDSVGFRVVAFTK